MERSAKSYISTKHQQANDKDWNSHQRIENRNGLICFDNMKDGRICLFALGDIFFCTTVLHRSSGYKHVQASFLLLRPGFQDSSGSSMIWSSGSWRLAKKKRLWEHTVAMTCATHGSRLVRMVWLGARILLIVLEHPVAPVNISGPEAPQAPQLVSNWRDHDMIISVGRWERKLLVKPPCQMGAILSNKGLLQAVKNLKKLGATGWAHPQWQDTAMRNPPPWQPRRHTPVAARKHCPDSSWTKQCTSQVSGQIGSPGGLSMGVLPRDYFTCRSIPFIVWFFVESGMENIQIKRCVWNMQFSTEHLAIAQKWGTNWPTVILIE